ncbi:3-deoxy-7-phosphoheptulonate synthase [Calothrix sp. FACHB-1219]|uniref:3-deoxy-7-phosphoheptulonate synthase n=1 Tax=unclassified Calothrix TaxID=2619626 RepID=UPI00168228D8|nr:MULTISPECIES: 3-deoxy-7-phosphoheptulonate synthase [unclassified Calothrix]MBD2206017.1 3-deoxy-7-phosphoheptulonate synthase [Calothrix sp. FACHB-168]MBD2220808.1 3-deoxy-7-phosphoheptulonate synthase [Calothrix sp. FACHB-1219]
MRHTLFDANIENSRVLLTPNEVKSKLPLTKSAEDTVLKYREELEQILDFQDRRKFIVVGPCSIHDPKAALEYSHKLKALAEQVKDKLLLVMRVYFEKPRTTVGWKGLINDPEMDDSFHVENGLLIARELLLQIAELGLPTATEALDPIVPQYISELVAWSAIGARTTESQTHREMASGLSMPVGFKNGTDGNIQVALNALQSARTPHNFLGINQDGQVSVFQTKGNPYGHVILRGGYQPNFDADSVKIVEEKLKEAKLPPRIVIDCSHGNTNKDYRLQSAVLENVIQQVVDGNTSIVGMMLESNLYEGNQPVNCKKEELKYGVSVTDKCISWEETERIILAAYEKLK